MSDETKVVMAIPQDVIQAQVRAAIAGVLNARGTDLIEAMVREVLDEPARDSYGREITRYVHGKSQRVTRFQAVLEGMITKAAEEEAKAWAEEQRDAIKKAVRAHLGKTHKDAVARIAATIIDQLAAPRVSLTMRFGDDDR